jgi:hypothetical protein
MTVYQGNNDPTVGALGGKYKLSSLDPSTATNGQVLVYSSSSGTWGPGSAVASALTDSHIFVGNGSNAATDVAVSGDLTLANTGAFTIANLAVTGTKIGLTSQAAGDIMYFNGTAWIRLAKGTAGQVLTMNGGATAPIWA